MSKSLPQNFASFSLPPSGRSPHPNHFKWLELPELALPSGIALCFLDLDSEPRISPHLLSDEERARADSFRIPVHRRRFVACRTALRRLLGAALVQSPPEVELRVSARGKPYIPGNPVHFNVAHSENHALLALAPFPVGVDVEHFRPIETVDLARHVFSRDEWRLWGQLPESARISSFFRLWTRKEALLKAMGCGIADHVTDLSVFFQNGAAPKFCSPALSRAARQGRSSDWQIRSFNPAADLFAAVAF